MVNKTEALIQSIQEFFGDTSQTREETISGLERAKNHIALLLETMEDEEDTDLSQGDGTSTASKQEDADTSKQS